MLDILYARVEAALRSDYLYDFFVVTCCYLDFIVIRFICLAILFTFQNCAFSLLKLGFLFVYVIGVFVMGLTGNVHFAKWARVVKYFFTFLVSRCWYYGCQTRVKCLFGICSHFDSNTCEGLILRNLYFTSEKIL